MAASTSFALLRYSLSLSIFTLRYHFCFYFSFFDHQFSFPEFNWVAEFLKLGVKLSFWKQDFGKCKSFGEKQRIGSRRTRRPSNSARRPLSSPSTASQVASLPSKRKKSKNSFSLWLLTPCIHTAHLVRIDTV